MKLLKALIFDIDGTVAETEELHRKAYNCVFSEEGISWTWSKELYKDLLKVTGGRERLKHYEDNVATKKYNLDTNEILRIHTKKNKQYNEWVNEGLLQLRPGIKTLIYKAREKNIQLAISTSTSLMNVKSLFKNCFGKEPHNLFKTIATGDMVKKKKPDPELYLLALRQLSLDPIQCIALEDSNNGLISAKKANIKTICSPSLYHSDDNFGKSDYICEEFTEDKLPIELRQLIFT